MTATVGEATDAPAAPHPSTLPLQGVRVLDLTRVIMGPFATQILADQGADVIIIEAAGGDTSRVMGPGPHAEFSGIALNLLRNKRSVVVDLKSESGMATVRQLVQTCDVAVATMRPNVLVRLGLDYDSLRAIRPDIVYCQAQGFALDSERADDPAYDDIVQAASGVSDMIERVWGHPALLPTIFADKVCGVVIAQAVSAALFARERTGRGCHVEVPMTEAMTAFMLTEHGSGAIPEPPQREGDKPAAGYPRVMSPERRPHLTSDGQVHLFPYLPKHYAALFEGSDAGKGDNALRYVDQRAALINSESLYRDVRKIAPQRTTAEWLAYCSDVGIPATEVATLQGLVDALSLDRHPVIGAYRVIPSMAKFDARGASIRRPAPMIGEHTDDVLAELAGAKADGGGPPSRSDGADDAP